MRLALPVAVLVALAVCPLSASAFAPRGGSPVPLVLQGHEIVGFGSITALGDRVALDDSGGWLVRASTATATAVLQNGAVAKRVGDPVTAPAGATITAIHAFDVSASGDAAWVLGLSTSAKAAYYGDSLVALTGTAPLDTNNDWSTATYLDFYQVFVNDSGQLLLGGAMDETTSFLPFDEFLSLITVNGAGTPTSEYVRYRTLWTFPTGASGFVDSVPVRPESTSLNELGHSLFFVREGGSPQEAIARDLTTGPGGLGVASVIVESFTSQPPPAPWIGSTALAGADLNASDDWVAVLEASPTSFGSTTERIFVSLGGTVSEPYAEGDTLGAIAPHALVALGFGGPIHLTDAGAIVWYGRWSDPNTARDEGFFLDDQLLVQEGVTTVGGIVLQTLHPASLALSPDGRFVAFRARLAGGVEGAFRIDLAPPITPFCSGDGSATACPCGNTGAAGRGCENSFTTGGGLLVSSGFPSVAMDDLVLSSSGMPSTATALYFQGTTQQNGGLGVVFGDGLRCAGGTVIRLGTKTSVGGASSFGAGVGTDPLISVRGLVPAGGGTRTYQVWYRNSAAFCTAALFNLTNALEVDWAP